MNLKNASARLITVNGPSKDGEQQKFRILPGDNPAVEVPDALCKSDFVKNLIEIGDLRIMPSEDADDLEALREEARSLGIEVDDRWKSKRLTAEIEKAKSGQ